MADPMQEQLSLDENVEESIVVELDQVSEDETTEEQPVQETAENEQSDEQEIENYSESVKKRINKLTYKIREAERREAAAVEYAQGVQQKLNSTQANLSQKDKNLYDEYSARVESQLASAEDRYRKAHDLGETEEMLSAQKDVAKLAVELESLNRVKPQAQETTEQPVAQQPVAGQQPVIVQQPGGPAILSPTTAIGKTTSMTVKGGGSRRGKKSGKKSKVLKSKKVLI